MFYIERVLNVLKCWIELADRNDWKFLDNEELRIANILIDYIGLDAERHWWNLLHEC